MTLTPELITAVTIGTHHAPPTGFDEGQILIKAVTESLRRSAGWIPKQHSQALTPPISDQPEPLCRPAAARYLGDLITFPQPEVMNEWAAEIIRRGERLPNEWLPVVLMAGAQERQWRDALYPLVQNRGRWLVTHFKRHWNWFDPPRNPTKTWTGSAIADVRLDALKNLRRMRPDKARALIEQTWKTDSANFRLRVFEQLLHNLSLEDEPLLERALDDPVVDIRAYAAELLKRMPESRHYQRLSARVIPMVKCQRPNGTWGKLKFDFDPPYSLDDALNRDGILPNVPSRYRNMSPEKWFLHQLFASVSPRVWCERFDLTLDELLIAAENTNPLYAIFDALAWATYRAQDLPLAYLLLEHHDKRINDRHRLPMFSLLSSDHQEALLLKRLGDSHGLDQHHPAFYMLHYTHHRWSAALSQAVLDSLKRYLKSSTAHPVKELIEALQRFALLMDPEFHQAFDTVLEEENSPLPAWIEMSNHVNRVMAFRRGMLRAFNE
ncbi:MAG: DUF5691 domain-containing protein [Anaerolineae bacterium]|jgi:hypothetical protein|nr:DUF5691 domain-containing protein [Anaerolineae bacterium]